MRYQTTLWIVALAGLLLGGCQKKEESSKSEAPPMSVEVLTITKAPIPIWVDFVGKTQANKIVDVVARVQGRLEKVHFTQGQFVQKGDLLFSIERSDYDAQYDRNMAHLNQDRASLELAKNDVARYRPLVEKDLAPREKLDQLISRQKEIESMIDADRATLAQSKLSVEYTQVRAEISGRIGRNLIDIGNLVGTTPENSKLATIVNDNPMYVYFSPSNTQVQNMLRYRSSKNMPTKATQPDVLIGSERKIYDGVIDFIDTITDPTTGTVTMRSAQKNPDGQLLSGTFVDLKVFITDKIPIIAVPLIAMGENQLGSFVYAVDANNTLRIVQVEIEYANKVIAALKEGSLKPGDKIVVSGLTKLAEGMKVSPTPTKQQLIPVRFE